jgi:hypothetical protein
MWNSYCIIAVPSCVCVCVCARVYVHWHWNRFLAPIISYIKKYVLIAIYNIILTIYYEYLVIYIVCKLRIMFWQRSTKFKGLLIFWWSSVLIMFLWKVHVVQCPAPQESLNVSYGAFIPEEKPCIYLYSLLLFKMFLFFV